MIIAIFTMDSLFGKAMLVFIVAAKEGRIASGFVKLMARNPLCQECHGSESEERET